MANIEKVTEIGILQSILNQVVSPEKESIFSFLSREEKEYPAIEEKEAIVLGKYRLIRLLGKGGMGIVFLAWDQKRCQKVALKLLKPRTMQPSCDELLRLSREIKILSSLSHPNIVVFYETGEVQYKGISLPCFSMEYIEEGQPLYCFLEHPNSIEWTMPVIQKIASAFIYAHQKNILHRDIKPGNIMLDISGNPKVLDFGLAKVLGETESFRPTQEKSLLGSPQYISPEQYRSPLSVDRKTDIYSLGAVLHHLLTGRLPVAALESWCYRTQEDKNTLEKIFQNWETSVDFSQDIHLDKHIEKICKKALEADVYKRYNLVEEFAQDLERYCILRSNSQDHFLFFKKGDFYPLNKKRIFLVYEESLSLVEKASPEHVYAELLFFQGSEYHIFIRKKLMLNGKFLSSGHQKLQDGDWIDICGNVFSYKKILRY